MKTSILTRLLLATCLLTVLLLTACGGGGDDHLGQADEPAKVTIDPPNCAASGACK
jgi:hypothetical protein